jgi:antitoxin ParD1/3/4
MTISLTPETEAIVQQQLSSGKYGSAEAVVGDALQLLQQQNRTDAEKLEELRREIAIGLEQAERGEFFEFDDELLAEIQQEARQERDSQPQ